MAKKIFVINLSEFQFYRMNLLNLAFILIGIPIKGKIRYIFQQTTHILETVLNIYNFVFQKYKKYGSLDQNPSGRDASVFFLVVALLLCHTPFSLKWALQG